MFLIKFGNILQIWENFDEQLVVVDKLDVWGKAEEKGSNLTWGWVFESEKFEFRDNEYIMDYK